MAESGWYDDPRDPHRLRWWDGQGWTDNVRDNELPPPTSPPRAIDPPDSTTSVPPWAVTNSGDDDLFDDEEDSDFLSDSERRERPSSLFEATQRTFRESINEEKESEDPQSSIPQRPPRSGPPIMERSPEAGSVGGASRPPWLADRGTERPSTSTAGSEAGRRDTPLPPWLRGEDERRRRQTDQSEGPRERPRPPWLRDEPPRGQDPEPSRPRYRDDFDDDDFMDRRRMDRERPSRPDPVARPASWEEMMEDFDEPENGGRKLNLQQENIRKYAFLGAGVAAGLLALFMLIQVFTGGDEDGAATEGKEPSIELVEIGEWSKWPDARGGYVVQFPTDPTYSMAADRAVWTAKVTSGDGDTEAVYRIAQKFVDPNYLANAGPEERANIAIQFLKELYPEFIPGPFETATLGSIPAREVRLAAENKVPVAAIFTLSENTLFVAAANENADTEKFFSSFGWFREPQLPPVPGR